MSTIHTAMTGKSDSLIDAVRDAQDAPQIALWEITQPKLESTHPDHPDYMRMVVHQMD